MDNKIAALYIRVSTDAQFEEGYSVDAQKEMLAAYCKSKNIKNYDFFVDGGFTGSNIERPLMQSLIESIKNNKISHVIVYKLDRLSRSQKDTLYLIEDVFLPHGVDFISINESFDTSTPFGRAMIGILSVFAQLERENIRERTRMGMLERVKEGLWMGGGRVPYGYDYDKKNGILIPNEDANNVKKMYDLYLQGYSCDRIAEMFGMKYDRLVSQILLRKTNVGFICYNGNEYKGKHEPIIDLETYENTITEMKNRSISKSYSSSGNLLTGLLQCGKCGAKMRYQKWGDSKKIYCYSQQTNKKYLIKDPNCDNEKCWADDIDTAVINDFLKVINMENKNDNKPSSFQSTTLSILNEQYYSKTKQIKNLYTLYSNNPDDILKDTIEENKKELQKIQNQIKIENDKYNIVSEKIKMQKTMSNLNESWDFMNIQEKRQILKSFIEKIEVTDNSISVYYKI